MKPHREALSSCSFAPRCPLALLRAPALLCATLALVLSALPTAGGQQARPAPEAAAEVPTGAITGRVLDEEGRPLPYALVHIGAAGAAPGLPVRSTGTDAEGNFIMEGLAPAPYRVTAYAPGYVPAPEESGETQTEPRYYRIGDSVTLRLMRGGIITGRITDSAGEPVVALPVRAYRIRDAEGRPLRQVGQPGERQTDDRGIYRLYGLTPGTYLIAAGGSSSAQFSFRFNPYHSDAPTYHPSSAREAAAEINVRSGEEASGIDIRYRGERGRAVSGTVAGAPTDALFTGGASVTLAHAESGSFFGYSPVGGGETARGFAFYGVPDGDYFVTAQLAAARGSDASAASDTRRITVRGADVTNLELRPAPLASLAGRITLEAAPPPAPDCEPAAAISIPASVTLLLRRDERETAETAAQPPPAPAALELAPRDSGEFSFRNLRGGRYRLLVRAHDEDLYVRSLSLPGASSAARSNAPAAGARSTTTPAAPAAPPAPRDAARDGITLARSEQATGLSVTLARGAAALRGRIIAAAAEGEAAESATIPPLPARLRVYLVPAERERADDPLHYYEAAAQADGSFALANLAPGRYFILARPAPERTAGDLPLRPVSWDTDARAQLRRDAAALNVALELRPCQRMSDYTMRY